MRSLILVLASVALAQEKTALDRYVAAPDENYSWKLVKTIEGGGKFRAYVLEMVSQRWLTEAEVDQPVWKHWLTVIRPPEVVGNTGFLFITGGSNRSNPPANPDVMLTETALSTRSVVAELRMVPNQPLKFTGNNGKETVEDASIAYTWDRFIRTGDEKWPLRLPMTKSAVRAMDAVTEFLATDAGGRASVSRFVVAGGSKRGWTTWTTAAVDRRVTAIVPLVIDLLNLEASFQHHWRVYGFWAPAVGDYVARDLMEWMGTPQNKALMKIEEPFEYRDRFTMPKYIVNSAGDQFFVPDSSQFYWDHLSGEKHLRYVPNSDHSLRGTDAPQSMIAFYDSVLRGDARPRYSWKIQDSGFSIECPDQPESIKLWTATNPEARDFRLEKIGKAYQSVDVPLRADGKYFVAIQSPAKGYSAHFVELTYRTKGKYPMKVTTGVKILPDTYPFPPPKTRASLAAN